MPMTSAGMSAAIKSAIQANNVITDAAQLQKFCDDLGSAIVTYIQANALVTVTGVTSGGSSATGGVS